MTSMARGIALGCALVVCLTEVTQTAPAQAPAPGEWHEFDATWTAAGQHDILPAEDGRTASIVRLSGSLVLTGETSLRRGFHMEAIGFDDGVAGQGRAVWTDDNGDRVYSRLVGASLGAGRRTMGTITGGTGRYAGVSGTYTLTWQYVLPGEQGRVHARTIALSGRYRFEAPR